MSLHPFKETLPSAVQSRLDANSHNFSDCIFQRSKSSVLLPQVDEFHDRKTMAPFLSHYGISSPIQWELEFPEAENVKHEDRNRGRRVREAENLHFAKILKQHQRITKQQLDDNRKPINRQSEIFMNDDYYQAGMTHMHGHVNMTKLENSIRKSNAKSRKGSRRLGNYGLLVTESDLDSISSSQPNIGVVNKSVFMTLKRFKLSFDIRLDEIARLISHLEQLASLMPVTGESMSLIDRIHSSFMAIASVNPDARFVSRHQTIRVLQSFFSGLHENHIQSLVSAFDMTKTHIICYDGIINSLKAGFRPGMASFKKLLSSGKRNDESDAESLSLLASFISTYTRHFNGQLVRFLPCAYIKDMMDTCCCSDEDVVRMRECFDKSREFQSLGSQDFPINGLSLMGGGVVDLFGKQLIEFRRQLSCRMIAIRDETIK